jgi:anthranilate phosphoribosyltransferase
MKNVKHILKSHAYQNVPLNYEEAYELGLYALKGCDGDELAQKQSIACLCALHTKATYAWQKSKRMEKIHGHRLPKNSAAQIAGICASIFEHDIAVSKNGYLGLAKGDVIGCCGMGGDLISTPNVSTVASFIAAAGGIFIGKHGSPGNTNRIGSSEFVSEYCGINIMASKKEAEKCLKENHFCYIEALDTRYKRIHLQTHEFVKLPHMNDIIGPITNPINPKIVTASVIGINHLIPPKIVAEAYKILNEKKITNLKHGLFVRGFVDKNRHNDEGMDEVSICPGGTLVAELKNGKIKEYNLFAEDFGLKPVSVKNITPKGGKGEFSLRILKGEISGPALEMVLANAALLFYLAGRSKDLKECYKMAKEIHQSGKVYETMLAVQKMIPKKH